MLNDLLIILNNEGFNYSNIKELKEDMSLDLDLHLDSIDELEFILAIEIYFNIIICHTVCFKTIGEIKKEVEELINECRSKS